MIFHDLFRRPLARQGPQGYASPAGDGQLGDRPRATLPHVPAAGSSHCLYLIYNNKYSFLLQKK